MPTFVTVERRVEGAIAGLITKAEQRTDSSLEQALTTRGPSH